MSDGERFISEIVDAMPTTFAKMRCIQVLSNWQGRSIYIPRDSSKSERRAKAALNMLINGMDKSEISNALIQRFGITSRQAYTDIKRAEISRNSS